MTGWLDGMGSSADIRESSPGAGSDPLGINRLSVDYDYLMYKINDYVQSIQIQTNELCKQQATLVQEGVIEGVIDKNVAGFKELLEKCSELNNYFDMLEQISMIAEMNKERLAAIYSDLRTIQGKAATKDLHP